VLLPDPDSPRDAQDLAARDVKTNTRKCLGRGAPRAIDTRRERSWTSRMDAMRRAISAHPPPEFMLRQYTGVDKANVCPHAGNAILPINGAGR